MLNEIHLGDCLNLIAGIKDKSIDLICADPPFNITAAKFDQEIIDLDILWKEYNRIIKDNCAICLFASQPFTSKLVCSNYSNFKYEWIWEKSKASNFLLARKQPLKAHESVLVFTNGTTPRYFPQKTLGKPFKGAGRSIKGAQTELVKTVPNPQFRHDNKGDRFPRSVQYFVTAENEGCWHPTQKPNKLLEYLIKTYSAEGDIILDSFAGSGSTLLAAKNLNRAFIGIEKEKKYFDIIKERLLKKPLDNFLSKEDTK